VNKKIQEICIQNEINYLLLINKIDKTKDFEQNGIGYAKIV
jgi:hypothetical protein